MPRHKRIVIGIVYDFDGTLCPGNMQEHQFIPAIGMSNATFWRQVGRISKELDADEVLIYMALMLQKAREKGVSVRRRDFLDKGRSVRFFRGVYDWFDRIKKFGRSLGVEVEHYIISSGNAEIIAGTPIRSKFRKVFASKFWFDENGVPKWPALAINYTGKTQFMFRINKGALDVSDRAGVNRSIPEGQRRVPFANIIFIGDGETDIPCFRLVKDKGGLALAVYKPRSRSAKIVAAKLLRDGRVNGIVPADYSTRKALEGLVKARIRVISSQARVGRAP